MSSTYDFPSDREIQPTTAAQAVGMRETAAKIVYDAFPFTPYLGVAQKPEWTPGGNSFNQDEARRAADKIIALAQSAGMREALEKAAHRLRELGYVDFANDCLAASQPSPAATVETPPDWKQDQAETSRLSRHHLDASKWPSKATVEASHARLSAETVEEIAKWLHDETGHPDSYPDHTWPETERDDGRRESGWVKIVPQHAQAYFRDIARRMVARFSLNEPQGARK